MANQNNKLQINTTTSKLVCCKLYISEGRNTAAMESIERAARIDPEAPIVNKNRDQAYNRVRYTLVSYVHRDGDSINSAVVYSPLRAALMAMVEAAFAAVNLELQSGTHPRFGAVDHICFHPMGRATLDDAAQIAKLVASDIGNQLHVPVFLYEAAHPTGKALDSIRRELGYFRPNMGSQWAGWALPQILPVRPDEGPIHVSPARGITAIGASPWIETYNVLFRSTDVPTVRRIARMVSSRGGGLPAVQALGLVNGDDTTEIACMLLDPSRIGADRVQSLVEEIAAQEGLEVEKGYFTEIPQSAIVERYLHLISSN